MTRLFEQFANRLRALQRRCGIALRNFQGDFAHLFVDGAVGGEDHGPAQVIRLTCEVADFSAGLFDQERAGRGVPLLQTEFPEAIEAARSYVSEIKRGGAIAAHAVGAQGKVPVVMNVGVRQAFVNWKTSTQQGRGKRWDLRDVNRFPVERGAAAARRRKQLIVKRVEDYARNYGVALRQCDGHGEARVAVSEIRCAVQGIDVPAKLRSGGAFVAGALFRDDGMLWKVFCEPRYDRGFRAAVGLRHQIDVTLVRDLRRSVELLA